MKYIRYLSKLSLIMMSLSILMSLNNDQVWCVTGYGSAELTYFSDLNGYMSNEPLLFACVAILGLLFALILFFFKSKHSFAIVMVIFLMLSAIPMSMFSTAPFYRVMYDSIHLCHNHWLLLGAFCFCYQLIFTSIYLFSPHKKANP